MKQVKDHKHQFWADNNPEGCITCGKTKEQILKQGWTNDLIKAIDKLKIKLVWQYGETEGRISLIDRDKVIAIIKAFGSEE